MTNGGPEKHILWHCSQLSSAEHCTLFESDDGYRFVGLTVLPLDDRPCHIEYSVSVDRQWRAKRVEARIASSAGLREIDLRARDAGGWEVDGSSTFEECDDVDLGWTPATNTIPIRRLGLEIGATASITAAWIRFPELDVVKNVQHYTRLADSRWLYQAGEYEFELEVDPASGLVLAYGDDLWRASAISIG